jgi:hypothetical protein
MDKSNEVNKFTYTAGADIYRFTFTMLYSRNGIGRIGYLIKARMDQRSQDNYAEVGSFQVTLTAV